MPPAADELGCLFHDPAEAPSLDIRITATPLRLAFLQLALLASSTLPSLHAQGTQTPDCSDHGTPAHESECADEFAKSIVILCALAEAKNSTELCECAQNLLFNPKKVVVGDTGAAGAGMVTLYNSFTPCPFGGFEFFWDANDPCNCIIVDPEFCPPDTTFDDCGPALMAAAFAHEICHSKTLTTRATGDNSPEDFEDECELAKNEVLCACLELDLLACLLSAGIAPIECFDDICERAKVVFEFKTAQQDLVDELCSKVQKR